MDMYLSRLVLDPLSRQVQRELQEPYEMHRTLMHAFAAVREESSVLFRVDAHRRTGVPAVLVQSKEQPHWNFLHRMGRYLFVASNETNNPACKSCDPKFTTGQLLAFRLHANPTFKRHGKRLAWLRERDQLNWLTRKGDEAGFRLIQALAQPIGMNTARKRDAHTNHDLSWFAVRFEGILQVTDPQPFHQALLQGIGPAKAFGCGLLSLAPLSPPTTT
jgi:CRISPR system Cascade subunit CasE